MLSLSTAVRVTEVGSGVSARCRKSGVLASGILADALSKVRAVCGRAARTDPPRTDPGGGQSAMPRPYRDLRTFVWHHDSLMPVPNLWTALRLMSQACQEVWNPSARFA